MGDEREDQSVDTGSSGNMLRYAILGVATIYVIASLYFLVDARCLIEKLEGAMGDLVVQSGLIAHTREDLELLKHRGDRNIYEFSLQKGERPTPVSTISLQLKKVDVFFFKQKTAYEI